MVELSETERKIAERLDPAAVGTVEFSQQSGGLGFTNMAEAMQFAKIMAISGIAVPKHLRGNVGACMAITIQGVEWRMSPFAVANKSYEVNGRLAYESQLIQAVILQRAPIKGRFDVEFSGEGEKRKCTVSATLKEGGVKDYTSPEIGKIPVKNSPLWKNDPDQQLFYYAGRALCRRFFPDVLLGIYTPEELYETAEPRRDPEHARDVTPKKAPQDKLDALAAAPGNGGQPYDPPHDPETGEIITKEENDFVEGALAGVKAEAKVAAMQDPTGEEAARQLAARLEERAADSCALEVLLDDAQAVAKKGAQKFKFWVGKLSAPDYARLEPHLPNMHEQAAEADAGRA